MAEAGKPSGDGLVQPLCSELGQQEQAAQDSLAFEHLQSWKLQNLFGQPAPVFDQPHNKRVVLQNVHIDWNSRKLESYKNTSDRLFLQEGFIYAVKVKIYFAWKWKREKLSVQ